eukprot:m.264725 g.264725  ORF g.264725 m.264725 type:complete len:509 (+) comp16233_c0_seq11:2407-3933(+)
MASSLLASGDGGPELDVDSPRQRTYSSSSARDQTGEVCCNVFSLINAATGCALALAQDDHLDSRTKLFRSRDPDEGIGETRAVVQGQADAMDAAWCILGNGRIVSVSGWVLSMPVSEGGQVVAVSLAEADGANALDQTWTLEESGCIVSRAHRLVLDVKGVSDAMGAAIIPVPRRQMNRASQVWFLVPRRKTSLPRHLREKALCDFRIIHVASGKTLDVQGEGKVSLFPVSSGSDAQCWKLYASRGGMIIENNQDETILFVAEDPSQKVRVCGRDILKSCPNRALWQFDSNGFLISRQDGKVIEVSPPYADAASLHTADRKRSVAVLSLMFKSLSTESQVFRLIPVNTSNSDEYESERDDFDDTDGEDLDQALTELDKQAMILSASRNDIVDESRGPSPLSALNPALKQLADKLFEDLHKDSRQRVCGSDLRPILLRTKQPPEVLSIIWSQVDLRDTGKVTYDELRAILGMVSQAQAGERPNIRTLDLITVAPPQIEGLDLNFTEVWM